MKASDLFVRALEREGVRTIFGVPGEENLDLLESLRHSEIRLVLTRHEQAAGFMAAAYGRLTGKTGVCLATLGPGATNFVTATSYALLGGMPVLFVTGQKPIRASKQGKFQIINVVQLMGPITKATAQIVDGNNIPHLVREFIRIAESEKPGPVHLELPEDVAHEDIDRRPYDVVTVEPPSANEGSLKRAARLVMNARRPLIGIAAGANRHHARKALERLLDRTGLYFFNTQMGKGAVDERHPKFLGTAALSKGDYVHDAIERADLLLIIGHDVTEKPPFFMHEGDPTQIIHLAYYRAEIDDVYYPHHEVIGDLQANASLLAELIQPSQQWQLDAFEPLRRNIAAHVHNRDHADRFPLLPQRVVSDVRDAMPSDGILSLDNGMYKIWFARNYWTHEPNTILIDNALATMGAGLPLGIGAKLTYPDRRVVCVTGDGGFLMNSQELETAVRLELDLVVLILRDDAFGMIKWKQQGRGFPDFGLDFNNPDFVKYAECFGAKGVRIERCGELTDTITRCFEEGGVHVVEIPIDYSENARVFYDELTQLPRDLNDGSRSSTAQTAR